MKYLSDVLIHRAACGLAAAVVFAALPAQAQPVTIMQISGYNMEPYPTTLGPSGNNDPMGIEDAMEALGTAGVSGMVYASLGESEARYYRTGQWTKDEAGQQYGGGVYDEVLYNRTLYQAAGTHNVDLILQMRIVAHDVKFDGAAPTYDSAYDRDGTRATTFDAGRYDNYDYGYAGNASNYKAFTADELLDSNTPGLSRFWDAFDRAVNEYKTYFPNGKIVLFEEETMYHSRDGGGQFWAGSLWPDSRQTWGMKPTLALDEKFRANFVPLYLQLRQRIRTLAPNVQVGIHIGHAPLAYHADDGAPYTGVAFPGYQGAGGPFTSLYEAIMSDIVAQSSTADLPDFTLYDLYVKVQGYSVTTSLANYQAKLARRVGIIRDALPGKPVYHLAQLHTTNAFGAGRARTPTHADLHATYELWQDLNLEGAGFYGKDTRPTNDGYALPSPDAPDQSLLGYDRVTGAPTGAKVTQAMVTAGEALQEDLDPIPNITFQKMIFESAPRRWHMGLDYLVDFRDGAEILRPTDDAMTRSGAFANTNYGGSTTIQVKQDTAPTTDYNRQSFLKFDISSLSTVSGARLRIYGYYGGGGATSSLVDVCGVADTTWSEGSITWSNQPTIGSSLDGADVEDPLYEDVHQFWEFDVGAYVQSRKLAGATHVAFALVNATVMPGNTFIHSKEAATNPPELIVTP